MKGDDTRPLGFVRGAIGIPGYHELFGAFSTKPVSINLSGSREGGEGPNRTRANVVEERGRVRHNPPAPLFHFTFFDVSSPPVRVSSLK